MRTLLIIFTLTLCLDQSALAQSRTISSLGRIEPEGGVVRLAGPSGLGSVIMDLKVAEGDLVEKGQVIAVLDSYAVRRGELTQLEVQLESANKQLQREQKLGRAMATSASKLETLELEVKAADAALVAARASLNLALVKAPFAGQIIYVHAHPGERVGVEGVVELGRTSAIYAVAEVYETDIIHIKTGQSATISSPALAAPVKGTVQHIGLKVGRMDVLGMDPIAEADARVVEVDILLDDNSAVKGLINLQVEVEISI
jgi:HlyD family secretion protein